MLRAQDERDRIRKALLDSRKPQSSDEIVSHSPAVLAEQIQAVDASSALQPSNECV